MSYELKHFDTTLLRFTATEDTNTPEINILWMNEAKKDLFPLDLESEKALNEYANTLVPCVYDDFIGTANKVLTNKHREGLRKLLEFKFKKNSRYNLPDKRLKLIEKMIQTRAKILLEK